MGVFNCIFVIIGVIIGAGFASGKEIYTFFFIYGKYGIIGIIIASFLIGLIIYKTLKIIKENNINNYDEFLEIVIGKKSFKYIDIKIVLRFIVNIFLLITFFVMCAGFGAYFKQELGMNEILVCTAFSVFCYFILNRSIKGVVFINSILIPIVIFVLIVLGMKIGKTNTVMVENPEMGYWVIKAIFYASYNSITLVSILIPLKGYINKKLDIFKISIICAIIILLLALIIFALLLCLDDDISKIELPTVYIAKNFGVIYKYLYSGIIVGAIMTTAISSAYAFLNNVSKSKTYRRNNFIICGFSIVVSMLGFSNLVGVLYPVFGLLGLIQLIIVMVHL